jgi:hypothetical protein
MSSAFRRFEILLPLRFNDGNPVPDELVADTILELREHFGAISWQTQGIRGEWTHETEVYRDDNTRVFVDVPESTASREFFVTFKEKLKQRFQQLDIWITSYSIDVI